MYVDTLPKTTIHDEPRRRVTSTGIVIGGAYLPKPPAPSKDAERAQAALLDPRTAKPEHPVLSLVRLICRQF